MSLKLPPVFSSTLQERQPLASKLLASALSRHQLSNAYLLTGRAIADKWLIARQLAAFLNCLSRQGDESPSCSSSAGQADNPNAGQSDFCQNCRWIFAGEHPQAWLQLLGEGKSGQVPVEKVRLLIEELNKTSRYVRVVIIPQADKAILKAASANALLKSIEEPNENVLFLLFVSSPEQVLPTIVSRSQIIPVLSPFNLGLLLSAEDNPDAVIAGSLQTVKSRLTRSAAERLSVQPASYLKEFNQSQVLAEQLLAFTGESESHEEPGAYLEPELLLDVFLASELELLRPLAWSKPQVNLYLSKLAELVETCKAQLDHYVKKKNVLETFAYCLAELRTKYLGGFCLAKN